MTRQKPRKVCHVCKQSFTPSSPGDLYCGQNCLAISDRSVDRAKAELDFQKKVDRGEYPQECPICGREWNQLIHKRRNGGYFLYQQYHFESNQKWVYSCHNCNLLEKQLRKKLGPPQGIAPEKLRALIFSQLSEKDR